MASLKEYFDIDFGHTFKMSGKTKFAFEEKLFEINGHLSFDFTSNCLFTSYYFDEKELTLSHFKAFLEFIHHKWEWNFSGELKLPNASLLKGLMFAIENNDPIVIKAQFPGELPIVMSELQFYGRIFIYSETQLVKDDIIKLKKIATSLNLHTQFRSLEYREQRSKEEKPLAFISHDSRDKELIARPIAQKLQLSDCPVWYDEYSLKVGDNLRETIEQGIKDCKKCVLILTPNFLNNGGWTKAEFNAIFTRQILEEQNLVLPVWSGISKEEIYDYSPSLLNIVGLQWNTGLDNVVSKLSVAIKDKQP